MQAGQPKSMIIPLGRRGGDLRGKRPLPITFSNDVTFEPRPRPVNSPHPHDERLLRWAIAAEPDSARAHSAFVMHLCKAGRVEDALRHLDHEAGRRPSSIWPLSLRAGVLSTERRAEKTIDLHRKLVAMAPEVAILWSNFGNDLAALGMTSEADAAYRNAVALAPETGAAWLGIANLRCVPFSDGDVEAMEQALRAAPDPHQKVQIFFALGRALDDRGDLARSFEHFTKANALRETLVPYDGERLSAFVYAHRTFQRSFPATEKSAFPEPAGAIFIVGMPRSGTTLVEQVLASHPKVEGLGELFALEEIAASVGAFDEPEVFIERLNSLTQRQAAQLRRDYLSKSRRYRRAASPFFTDKMPANWSFVALIQRILPDARIVDVRRDPLACGFSAFTTYFNRSTDFPNRLDDVGQYYRLYRQMMTMARASAPNKICEVDYERVVSDPDREIPALLHQLQLPFAEACLRPERNRRAVYTPSAQQVRLPIHQTDNRFRDYLPWLAPLQAALGS